MKVTADTITDEQIRELREWSNSETVRASCRRALHVVERVGSGRALMRARERCAAAWNARHGGES